MSHVASRIDARERRLERLGFRDYTAFLKSACWSETRSAYWTNPDTQKVCAVCGTNEPPLPLHHRTYDRVGEERLDDLTPVCLTCHSMIHALEHRGDLPGLDADLGILSDPIRAAAYRQLGADRRQESAEAKDHLERKRRVIRDDVEIEALERRIANARRKKGKRPKLLEDQRDRAIRRRLEKAEAA